MEGRDSESSRRMTDICTVDKSVSSGPVKFINQRKERNGRLVTSRKLARIKTRA